MVESGQPGIVVANERYVVGHAQASFLENVQRSDGRQVVGHEDRGGEHGGSEQLGGSPAATGVGVVALHDHRFEVTILHGQDETAPALGGTRPQPSVDVGDTSVTELDEVVHGQLCPADVVIAHGVD